MAQTLATEKDLRREIENWRERFPNLPDDHLFVLWFLRAFVTDDEKQAANALTGGAGDKGIDAVLIDDSTRTVFILQGKYRQKVNSKNESRSDVVSFANLAHGLWGDSETFRRFSEKMNAATHQRLSTARERLKKRGYRLKLYFVTLGKCSSGLRDEVSHITRAADGEASIEVFDGRKVLLCLGDYLDGVAPPVPSLDLEMETGHGVRSETLRRHDSTTGISSWVFSMTAVALADLYQQAGIRLFARNIRGFLEDTAVNKAMVATLNYDPLYFWYYNNGITIICDEAEQVGKGGRDLLKVSNPQIINGQQTTRTLYSQTNKGSHAAVLVRVIVVPRSSKNDSDRFETLVSRIVEATNFQNAIRASDLMSNDRRQIELERALRKIDYFYLRKRQSKGEARRVAGIHQRLVKKEEIAQAVAACDLDPAIVREGKEALFEKQLYEQIFPTGDPNYYLSRYRLMRLVTYASRGFPERAYAKWLALHHVWGHLQPLVRSHGSAQRFRRNCERDTTAITYLLKAISIVFVSALKLYRAKRGKGATAQDVSSFFRRRGLVADLEKFMRGPGKQLRTKFRKEWGRFEKRLEASA